MRLITQQTTDRILQQSMSLVNPCRGISGLLKVWKSLATAISAVLWVSEMTEWMVRITNAGRSKNQSSSHWSHCSVKKLPLWSVTREQENQGAYLFPFCDFTLFSSSTGSHSLRELILMSLPAECLDTNNYSQLSFSYCDIAFYNLIFELSNARLFELILCLFFNPSNL